MTKKQVVNVLRIEMCYEHTCLGLNNENTDIGSRSNLVKRCSIFYILKSARLFILKLN